jgi:rare lipoprotein A
LTSHKALVFIAATLMLAGCGHKRRVSATPAPVRIGQTETGFASWYGHPYHGRQAADGEIYDMEKMTAAHRTLPFNTWVRVYDLDNQKTTEVRIIDRGPFIDGRIIDLSRAAARNLEMIGPGTARVRIEVIRAPETATAAVFAVQVGAFQNRATADRLRADMENTYGAARLVQRSGNPAVWRVLVGSEPSQEEAGQLAAKIRENSSNKIDCFIVRIDAL